MAALALSLGAIAIGLALSVRAPLAEDARGLAIGDVPAGLLRGDGAAWLSLGALVLLALPAVRVAGILLTLRAEGDRRGLVAGAVLLVILLGGLAQLGGHG